MSYSEGLAERSTRETLKLGNLASVSFWQLLIIELVARSVPARLIIC